jgi:hypothetical protein
MKKEGIQTRNRKLSAKGKKKKGCLSLMPDMNKTAFSSFNPAANAMSPYMYESNKIR